MIHYAQLNKLLGEKRCVQTVGIIILKTTNLKILLNALTVAKMWTQMDSQWWVAITVEKNVKHVALHLAMDLVNRYHFTRCDITHLYVHERATNGKRTRTGSHYHFCIDNAIHIRNRANLIH